MANIFEYDIEHLRTKKLDCGCGFVEMELYRLYHEKYERKFVKGKLVVGNQEREHVFQISGVKVEGMECHTYLILSDNICHDCHKQGEYVELL